MTNRISNPAMLNEKDEVHDTLFSEATLKLGEIHWTLLKSADVMDSQRWQRSTHETTAFGKKVGLDEIHWWVFEKDTDVDELLAKTERTLESAQALKNAASKSKNTEPESYRDLSKPCSTVADTKDNSDHCR